MKMMSVVQFAIDFFKHFVKCSPNYFIVTSLLVCGRRARWESIAKSTSGAGIEMNNNHLNVLFSQLFVLNISSSSVCCSWFSVQSPFCFFFIIILFLFFFYKLVSFKHVLFILVHFKLKVPTENCPCHERSILARVFPYPGQSMESSALIMWRILHHSGLICNSPRPQWLQQMADECKKWEQGGGCCLKARLRHD